MDTVPLHLLSLLISVISIYLSNVYGLLSSYIEERLTKSILIPSKSECSSLIKTVVGIEFIMLAVIVFLTTHAYLDRDYTTLELSVKLLSVELSILSLFLFIINNRIGGIIVCCLLPILIPTYSCAIHMASYIQPHSAIIAILASVLLLWKAVRESYLHTIVLPMHVNLDYLQRYTVLYTSVTVLIMSFSQNTSAIHFLMPTVLTLPLWILLSLFYHSLLYIFRNRDRGYGPAFLSPVIPNMHRTGVRLKAVLRVRLECFIERAQGYDVHLNKGWSRISTFATSIKLYLSRIMSEINRGVSIDSLHLHVVLSSIVRASIEIEEKVLRLVRHNLIRSLHTIQKSFEKSLIAFSLILGLILLLAIIVYAFITTI
ncbi:MAG: hypothetical protein N3D82_01255 [Ignisphaera sp.]|nr:hypothetical protein [Ignisphaera sp.]MCX8167644.1 hypothetical protein [Ignisphaera sp.]MDW8085635.1 hypothetical protein [Ignisphaera sp.]